MEEPPLRLSVSAREIESINNYIKIFEKFAKVLWRIVSTYDVRESLEIMTGITHNQGQYSEILAYLSACNAQADVKSL